MCEKYINSADFVAASNNIAIVFTINYYAWIKQTDKNNDCTDIRQY